MALPRERDMRRALNRYFTHLCTQQALLAEVTSMAGAIDLNDTFGLQIRTAAVAQQLMPLVEPAIAARRSDDAWRFLLDYGWLWPALVAAKPEFVSLRWLAIPRDWHQFGRPFQSLLTEGNPRLLPDTVLKLMNSRRDYQFVVMGLSNEAGMQRVRTLDERSVRTDEDLSGERLFLYQRLLRILLANKLKVSPSPLVWHLYIEEVWQDWCSHPASEQAHLRPFYARSLREMIRGFAPMIDQMTVNGEWSTMLFQFCSFARQLGNRPERRTVDEFRQRALALASQAGSAGKSAKWEEVRKLDMRLNRGKAAPTEQVLVIQQALATKNRDAKPFERLTQPLPVHRVLPRQVQAARVRLTAEFPWLTALTQRILDEVESSLWMGESFARFAPVLLVSKPGIGKSRYVRRLAELLRTPLAHVVMNGMKSSMQLKGSSSGWGDSRPSVFIEHMLWLESANYLVLLDEIDKCSTSDYNGNPLDVLLSFLERENAARFADECLGVKVDLSRLSFIATANDISRLPGPLLSRFRVIEVDPPSRSQLSSVVIGARDDRARELGVDPRMLPLMQDEVEALARSGRSPREVFRLTLDYLMQRELADIRAPQARH